MKLQDVRIKGLRAGLLGAGLLGVMSGTSGMMMAQEPARDEARPQDARPEEAKPKEARPEGAKPQEAKPEEARPRQDEAKPSREQAPARAEEGKPVNNGHPVEKQNGEMRPAERNGGDHATQASGRRIPDDKFRSSFGRQHTFRVQTTVVEGQPRFQYSGFWFSLANPWPVGWSLHRRLLH